MGICNICRGLSLGFLDDWSCPIDSKERSILGDIKMNRFSLSKALLLGLVAVGGLSSLGVSEADAGWYGRRCYTSSYSYSPTVYRPVTYSYSPTCFRAYSPVVSYNYAPVTYTSPSYFYSPVTISHFDYGGFCYPQTYNACYGTYGGFYGGVYGGYSTPIAYGNCGW